MGLIPSTRETHLLLQKVTYGTKGDLLAWKGAGWIRETTQIPAWRIRDGNASLCYLRRVIYFGLFFFGLATPAYHVCIEIKSYLICCLTLCKHRCVGEWRPQRVDVFGSLCCSAFLHATVLSRPILWEICPKQLLKSQLSWWEKSNALSETRRSPMWACHLFGGSVPFFGG